MDSVNLASEGNSNESANKTNLFKKITYFLSISKQPPTVNNDHYFVALKMSLYLFDCMALNYFSYLIIKTDFKLVPFTAKFGLVYS